MAEFRAMVRAVSAAIQARVPVLLNGEPGVAKTAIVGGIFEVLAEAYETVITAVREPSDLGGYPVPGPEGVSLQSPSWVRRLALVPREKIAGLFLDELSSAPPATRAAALRGILDSTFGETRIEALSTVAAMNPPEIAESGYELSAPLANRFCHIRWIMPAQYWIEQMVAGFPAPPGIAKLPHDWWQKQGPKARTYVAAFGTHRPNALQQMPAEASRRSGPWPSYRTWTMATRCLAATMSIGESLESDATLLLISGCVGDEAAREFLTYSRELDLPDPEELLKDPSKLVLPKRGDRAYAILVGVVSAVLSNNTGPRWNQGWGVLQRAVELNAPDIAAGAARALAQNKPANAGTPKPIGAFVPLLKAAGLM